MKTAAEVEKLKKDWENDPCWDLYETKGFEDYAEELRQFQKQKEAEWNAKYEAKERAIDAKAEELGIQGLYRLILEIQELQERQSRAINLLTDGYMIEAYQVLNGRYPD